MDPTTLPLCHAPPAAAIEITAGTYGDGLPFELFRAAGAMPRGAVVILSGFADPGAARMFGKPMRAWTGYRDWAARFAAAGLAGVLYENREPADAFALVAHLRANAAALGLDASRIGAFACSGHGPNALAVLAREQLAAAALLYPYTLDLGGATGVADALAQFRGFAAPPVALADLRAPLLLVRAADDAMPGLNAALDAFAAAVPSAELLAVPGPHAFDLLADTPATHAAIDAVLAFLARHLA